MYLDRALGAFPHATPLPALNAGLDALARTLPVGSPLVLYSALRVSTRLQQLQGKPPAQLHAALDLARLLAHLLTVVDLQVGGLSEQEGSSLELLCCVIWQAERMEAAVHPAMSTAFLGVLLQLASRLAGASCASQDAAPPIFCAQHSIDCLRSCMHFPVSISVA